MDDYITATNVVAGQKVGWALGSMLYEINTLPWKYITRNEIHVYNDIIGKNDFLERFLGAVLICVLVGFALILRAINRRYKHTSSMRTQYSSIGNVELEQDK